MSFDWGLLSPVTAANDETSELVGDLAFARYLVDAEVALARSWSDIGLAPQHVAGEIAEIPFDTDLIVYLTAAATSGGNPVIPLVQHLKQAVSPESRPWVHRGATSQDIMDTALMLLLQKAVKRLLEVSAQIDAQLRSMVLRERETVAAGRTLTQHAVPVSFGLRVANWLQGTSRAGLRLQSSVAQLPAQLGGAAGTAAAFVEIAGSKEAEQLIKNFSGHLGLAVPGAPWHTVRWPITELADALTQFCDSLGVFAADIATLSRTEIAEVAEAEGGTSSAMPQKSNPVGSVLLRSAALRAPYLSATLHAAGANSVDERPEGAWHAEWPTIRELMRLSLGSAFIALKVVQGLEINHDRVAANLLLTGEAILAEQAAIDEAEKQRFLNNPASYLGLSATFIDQILKGDG